MKKEDLKNFKATGNWIMTNIKSSPECPLCGGKTIQNYVFKNDETNEKVLLCQNCTEINSTTIIGIK